MEVENRIRKFILENFILDGDEILGDEDSLLEKGIIDSTGVLELVAFIEENYSFKIKDEELVPENLDSIKNISQYVQNKLNLSYKSLNRGGGWGVKRCYPLRLTPCNLRYLSLQHGITALLSPQSIYCSYCGMRYGLCEYERN